MYDKFLPEFQETPILLQMMEDKELYIFHLSKIAAAKEMAAIYEATEAVLVDHLMKNPVITNEKGCLLAHHMPYLFFYMDSEVMYEKACEYLYTKP